MFHAVWQRGGVILLGLALSSPAAPAPCGEPETKAVLPAPAPPPEAERPPPARPPHRPAWLDTPADYSGPIHRIPVGSGPYATPQEARRALDRALEQQVAQYIREQLAAPQAGGELHYDAATIRQRWVPEDKLFEETIDSSVGPMHRAFALLELGPEMQGEIERRWRVVQSRQRLWQLGIVSAVVLSLLAVVRLGASRGIRVRPHGHPTPPPLHPDQAWGGGRLWQAGRGAILILALVLAVAMMLALAAYWWLRL